MNHDTAECVCPKCADRREWLDRVIRCLMTRWDYTQGQARVSVYDAEDEWLEFYDDGYTPEQAASEDMTAGAGG